MGLGGHLDTMVSVGPPLIQSFVTAEPKGAYGTTDEDLIVLTCACLCDQHTTHLRTGLGGQQP